MIKKIKFIEKIIMIFFQGKLKLTRIKGGLDLRIRSMARLYMR